MGLTDCISPNTYLSIEGKLRGVSQDVRVESLSDEEMEIQEFMRNITRHIVACLSALVYDHLGRAFGIMMVSIKILLSRTCEVVPGIGMMNTELYALDQELVELIVKLLKNIRNVSFIRPFPRPLIPSGNSLSAIVSFCYGGILALGSCVYMLSKKA